MISQLNLHIEKMDSTAFYGCAREECAEILEKVARKLRNPPEDVGALSDPSEDGGELIDSADYKVGFWYADFPTQEQGR